MGLNELTALNYYIFWIHSKYFCKDGQLLCENYQRSYFGWIYDIYYIKTQSEDNEGHTSSSHYKLMPNRIAATIAICLIELFNMVLVYKSYYLVSTTHVNTGITGSLYWFKIVLISIAFYFIFNQILNLFDYLGIAFWIAWISLVSLSKYNENQSSSSWNFIFAVILMLINIIMQVPKDAIMKYYFWYKVNNVNIIAFRVFHDVILYFFIWIVGVWMLWNDFNYSFQDIVFSSISGVLHLTSSLLGNFIITRSMAGPAEALLSTSTSMHVLMDLIVFGGKLSLMQSIGILFSILSTIWIIIGSRS